MPGIASVAEYGPELIVGAGGRIALATGRQYMSFEGGETIICYSIKFKIHPITPFHNFYLQHIQLAYMLYLQYL